MSRALLDVDAVLKGRRSARTTATYVEWCAKLGVQLTPGQLEVARVAYDGGEPSGPLGEVIWGDVGAVPPIARNVVAAVCGARAGKSYVLVALRLLWGMYTRDLRGLAPGQRAVALIVAPNHKLRGEVLAYALGAVRSSSELRETLVSESADGFVVRRADGREVAFETGVATAGGYGARGRALTDFALDECAFFRDSSFKVNDEEIFRAGAARVLPGGQVIVASTPWATSGLLHDLWKRNWGKPQDALVAHAPTLVMHDSRITRERVEAEALRDPDNAKREFGAEFMTSGTTAFFELASLEAATTDESFTPQPGDMVAAGADLGFRSDSSALVLVALRGTTLHVYGGTEERPQAGAPLSPEATFAKFAELLRGRTGHLMADGHYQVAMQEALSRAGLVVVPAPAVPSDVYVRARQLLRAGRVKVHPLPFRERLMRQLAEVKGKPTSGGGMSITHPRWSTGGHGDIADALVLALWQVSGDEIATPPPAEGTREWEQERKRARYEALRAEEDRPWWRRAR